MDRNGGRELWLTHTWGPEIPAGASGPKSLGLLEPSPRRGRGRPGPPCLLPPPQGLGSRLARSSLFLGPDLSVWAHFTDCSCPRQGWGGGTWGRAGWRQRRGWHPGDGGWDSSACCSERGAPPPVPVPASHGLATWPSRLLTHPQGLHPPAAHTFISRLVYPALGSIRQELCPVSVHACGHV